MAAKQLYYPSLVVNLRVRFDEAYSINVTQQPDPTSTEDLVTGQSSTPAPLTSEPLLLNGEGDQLSSVVGRIPTTCTVEIPGYRQAGTFDMTLAYRDLPIDPRLIRAIGVEVYVGSIRPQDFAFGIVGADPDGRRRSILDITGRTPLLVGVADTGTVDYGENGVATVHFAGRDLRGMLLDAKVDPRIFENLDLTKNIVNVVQQIVSKHPYGAFILVDANPDDWNNLQVGAFGPEQPLQTPTSGSFGPSSVLFASNIPSPGSRDGITRVRRGADGKQATSSPPGDADKLSFWDLITRYCFLVGAVPFFSGRTLRVRPARSLYDYTKTFYDPRIPTPFLNGLPRDIIDGAPPQRKQISIRNFVYGRNLKSLKFERKFAGTKVPTVEVVSYDSGSSARGGAKLISARWPAATGSDPKKTKVIAKAKTTGVAPSGQSSDNEILRIPIAGITDKAALTQIAMNIYEEIGRGEQGGSAVTSDLASFGGDGSDPDNLTMLPGDPVRLSTDTRALSSNAPLVGEVIDHQRRSFDDEVQVIAKRIGDVNFARVLVATARGLVVELQSVFRVNTVKYSFAGGIIGIEFDFQNYVEARADVGPQGGANQAAVGKSSTPKLSPGGSGA